MTWCCPMCLRIGHVSRKCADREKESAIRRVHANRGCFHAQCLHSKFGRPHVGWFSGPWRSDPSQLHVQPDGGGIVPPPPPPLPRTTLVFCDIEKPLERHCATAVEKATGVRLNAAAVALVGGQSGGNIGLDDSPAARARCSGEPEAVTFRGDFPTGNPMCVRPFAIGPPADPTPRAPTHRLPFRTRRVRLYVRISSVTSTRSGSFIPDFPPAPR